MLDSVVNIGIVLGGDSLVSLVGVLSVLDVVSVVLRTWCLQC